MISLDLASAWNWTWASPLSAVIGRSVKLRPRTPELWGYYWETIDRCVAPERVLEALRAAGFDGVGRFVKGGILSESTGVVKGSLDGRP